MGRKKIQDHKVLLGVYVEESRIEKLGGRDKLREDILTFIESKKK